MVRNFVRSAAIVLLCTGIAGTAFAQVGEQGSITGTLTDPQGAVLPGVTVAALNTTTNVTRTAVTTEAGVYLLTGLVTGTYKVTFTMPSFKPSAREIEVRTGERLRVDIKLELGGLTDEIKVVAETPLLNTTTASRATIIDSDKVTNTPLNGQNPFMFVYAAPGVLGDSSRPSISYRPFDNGGMDQYNVNGGVGGSNRFLLDGTSNTNSEGGSAGNLGFVPSPDAVQEVRVDTNTYDAQFGRTGGGTVSVSVKSGTNRLSGTASYMHRDKSLNQNLYQNIQNNIPKTDLFHVNPVFTIGGPVILPKYDGRNKTFFFYSYEFLKSAIPDNANAQRTPTDLEMSGDFSQSVNGVAGGAIFDPLNGLAFPNNRIPAANSSPNCGRTISCLDPISMAYAQYMTRPNVAPDAQGNNFIASPNSRADVYNSHLVRVDHNFGDVRFFTRYGHNGRHEDRANSGRQNIAVTNDGHHYRWNDNLNGDLTWSLNPSTVSNLKVGWTRHERRDLNITEEFNSASLGYAPSYLDLIPRTNFMQPISIDNYNGANVGSAGNGFHTNDHVITVSEALTKLWGGHQFKVGGEYGMNFFDQGLAREGANVGAFNFTRNYTSNNPGFTGTTLPANAQGNALASFLIGYPRSQSITLAAVPDLHFNASYFGVYFQDDWRVSNRLTLNVGLRYDYEVPVREADNLIVDGFDYTSQNPLALQCTGCPAAAARPDIASNRADGGAGLANLKGGVLFADGRIYNADGNNFGPRVGVTYQLSEKMLLRGGYGKSFLSGLSDRGTQAGNTRATAYNPSINNNLTPASNLSQTIGLLYPTGLLQPLKNTQGLATNNGTNISFHIDDREIQAFQQYSAEIQYQMPWRSVVTMGYVGSRTDLRPITQQLNDLTPQQLALGDTFLNELVPNPFVGLLPGSSFNGQSGNNATIQRRQLLRPYPQFNDVSMQLIPEGRLWYNSLQAQWEKRLTHGVSMLVSYTFSRSWEETDPLNAGEPRYIQRSGNDRPHALRINGTWTMPTYQNHSAWVRHLAGGWQTAVVANIRTGGAVGMPNAVDVIGDVTIVNPTKGRWFNTCTIALDGSRNACADANDQRANDPGRAPLEPAFQVRPANALDTTGSRMDDVRSSFPAIIDMNFSKSIRLSQRVRSQIRVDLYNLTGAVQWPGPNTGGNNGITDFTTFGTVASTQSNDPRFVMLTFKILY